MQRQIKDLPDDFGRFTIVVQKFVAKLSAGGGVELQRFFVRSTSLRPCLDGMGELASVKALLDMVLRAWGNRWTLRELGKSSLLDLYMLLRCVFLMLTWEFAVCLIQDVQTMSYGTTVRSCLLLVLN